MNILTRPPDMPGALPVLGHALQLMRDPAAFLRSAATRGLAVGVRMGPQRMLLMCDPELTRQILVHDRVFDKGGDLYERVREVVGNGLLSCPYSDHRRQRRLLQPAFHKSRIPLFAEIIAEHVYDVVDSWRDGEVIDVPAQMQTIAARVIVATMFSGSLPAQLVRPVLRDMTTITSGIYRQALMPRTLRTLPLFGNRQYAQAQQRLRRTLGEVIARRRAEKSGEASLLSLLLDNAAEQAPGRGSDRGLSDAEVRDQILTFFIAGMETTGNVLAWALHLLAGHQDVQKRLHEETADLPGRGPKLFPYVDSLDLTRNVLRETLRLYPPVWLLTRTASTSMQLGALHVPAGATVAFSQYLVQRLPAVHPRPDRFDPDRWATAPARQVPSGGFIPFGLGARKCIGEELSLAEATLALTAVSARWRLEPVTEVPVRYAKDIVVRPHVLRLRVTRRNPADAH